MVRGLLVVALLGGAFPVLVVAAGADPPARDWSALRGCESSGRYDVVATNGHYGAYQFDLPTWRSVGGTGFPSVASPAEQDYRALILYRQRGWQPWECAGILGLKPDADAGSGDLPTRADSAYMAPGGTAVPGWPGKVFAPGVCDPALGKWQLRMNRYGYGFTGTGCYGAKTATAVLDLQRANGIKTSGLLGPKTWAAAWTGTAPTRQAPPP